MLALKWVAHGCFFLNYMNDPTFLELAQDLIRLRTDPGESDALNAALSRCLLELAEFPFELFDHQGVKSILVRNTPDKPERYRIIFNCHLDVIPAKIEQYTPKIAGDKLYGAGSMDMKSNLACVIEVFKELAKDLPYPIALQIVTDEETGGFNGTRHQVIDAGIRADFVIATEPTNLEIVNTAKGVLQVRITASGTAAHGAYPWKGRNAILVMHAVIANLQKHFGNFELETEGTTVNVATISTSNTALNKVPDACTAEIDIRYVEDDQTTILGVIHRIMLPHCALEVIANEPAVQTEENDQYIQKLNEAIAAVSGKSAPIRGAAGTSDLRHYTQAGCQGIEFGPIGGGIGSDEEWVDIPSLVRYKAILKAFLLSVH